MRGFILVYNGRALPDTFRFSREACKACTLGWKDEETGRFHDFKHWNRKDTKCAARGWRWIDDLQTHISG
ncbi:hypothetical protein AWB73_00113 [Caballeronia turbans]|nr:hypothetical protein AWB73_00113 [Caballeronia turbans]